MSKKFSIKRQEIYMNNDITSKITNDNINYLWDNILTSDEIVIKQLSNLISNPYQLKLNLIQNILNTNIKIPLNNYKDIIKFFNVINPLNNEYRLGSDIWNSKISNNILFVQNSISKNQSNDILYDNYINLIKKKLLDSQIEFNYFEFKTKRFNKTIDIVWTFDLSLFN